MRVHSYLSPKCEVRPSPMGGIGVFAVHPFSSRELIAIWGGIVLSAGEVDALSQRHPEYLTKTFSIWEGFYQAPLAPNAEFDDCEHFNHSCDPNAGVFGQIVLLARRTIAEGEEICFDYDTTETEPLGGFPCRCGAPGCRGLIDGSAWLDPNFIERNREWLSSYILERVRRRDEIA